MHKEASQYCTICKKYGHKKQFCKAEGHLTNISLEQRMVDRKAVMTRLLGRSYQKFNESWGGHVFPMICLVVHDSVTNLLCRKDGSGNEVVVTNWIVQFVTAVESRLNGCMDVLVLRVWCVCKYCFL